MRDNTRYDYSPIIRRPALRWPNNARIAVWVIINVEHFKIDMGGTSLNPFPSVIPDVYNYAWRDYGPRVGIWRLMRLLDRHGIRAAVTLNSDVCIHNPIIIEEGVKRDWEWLGHGITNSQSLAGLAEDQERQVIRTVFQTIKKATGKAPEGWLGPALAETFNTPDLLAEEGFTYVCDWNNDDQPYPMKVRKGRLLSVPYSAEINDIPNFLRLGHAPEVFRQIVCDQFDTLYEEGAETGRVMAIALHPFIIGQPFRIKYLDQALQHIKRHKDVWFTTGAEIARWYATHYPAGR
jgi:peptidoglycan/xylan/chitin deacetylase (PgdA/CDA1 family)